jgi:TDG/mug DNA glycosylase family protein
VSPTVLPDYLKPDLDAVFVGTAVGIRSAAVGGYYAGRGNQFWELLYQSGLTPVRLSPDCSGHILAYGLDLTDLAKRRASSRDSELLREDFDVAAFIAKVERLSPRWVAFNGKTPAEVVSRYLGEGRHVALGRQPWTVATSRVFVLPSTSGANSNPASLEGKASKLDWFRAFRRTMRPAQTQRSFDPAAVARTEKATPARGRRATR